MNRLHDIERDEALSTALLTTSAANEDSVSINATRTIASGWDAFEVWRRTIKEPRDRRYRPQESDS